MIKRENSIVKKEDRPSTAPSKESKDPKQLASHNSLKRLPSPNIKCKF